MDESDPRSDVHYLGSSENKYAKKVVLTLKEIYGSSQWHNLCFFFCFFTPWRTIYSWIDTADYNFGQQTRIYLKLLGWYITFLVS